MRITGVENEPPKDALNQVIVNIIKSNLTSIPLGDSPARKGGRITWTLKNQLSHSWLEASWDDQQQQVPLEQATGQWLHAAETAVGKASLSEVERAAIVGNIGAALLKTGNGPGIPGQVTGFWFNNDADIPNTCPTYNATGAILLDRPGAVCLDLVMVEGVWLPLSESGAPTYAHSSSLLAGETILFAVFEPWGKVYEISLGLAIEYKDIGGKYGEIAARRARPDRTSFTVKLLKAQ